jgi:type IV secretion system protein VirB6
MACFASPTSDRLVSPLLTFLDCQAATLGEAGYQALSAPGSTVSLMIGAMLAILIAVIGYRLLLGDTPTLRDGVLTFVKIGIVLAFTASWPAYRTIVYDVVLRAPADIVANVGGNAQIPGTTGSLAPRLDALDQSFRTLAIYGVGVPTKVEVEEARGVAPPLFASFDSFALGAGRLAFLTGSLTAFALLRLGAGLLLALGPLFFAFLLFDAARGLFEGWVRGLVALTLGSIGTALAIGVELALFQPWLDSLIAQRAAGQAIPNAATSVFATAIVFTLVLFALLGLTARVASGWRLPARLSDIRAPGIDARSPPPHQAMQNVQQASTQEARSRALILADQVSASQRREQASATGDRHITVTTTRDDGTRNTPVAAGDAALPLGRSFRRTRSRVSVSAGARDSRI